MLVVIVSRGLASAKMTAEIAIANSGAVALAADSAVTISGGKVYNSALKLFALSKVHPVGVMVYGSADFLGIPWETLIKNFRQELGSKEFNSLNEYADAFFAYLEGHGGPSLPNYQADFAKSKAQGFFEYIRNLYLDAIRGLPAGSQISEVESQVLFMDIVQRLRSDFLKAPFADGFTDGHVETFRSSESGQLRAIAQVVFENVIAPDALEEVVVDVGILCLFKRISGPFPLSGLVFAGYGKADFFPVITSYEVDGMLCGRVKKTLDTARSAVISRSQPCSIIPFAQDDMAMTFIKGIDPFLENMLVAGSSELMQRLFESEDLLALEKENLDGFKKHAELLLAAFKGQVQSHMRDAYVEPVMSMACVLPKNELASMAEALVSLTAFKRRVTHSSETVGGPIDVAVISKCDGFVWVKRKHYFPAELNQHFFANYYRGF